MAKIGATAMSEAVMARVEYEGRSYLIEYTPEQALRLASAFIDAAEKSLSMDAAFTARFLRASQARRLGNSG